MPTLVLKESSLKKAQRIAENEGFATVSEYLEDLINRDALYDMPPSFSTKEELEALILEGLNSPSEEMTKEDWQKLRDEILGNVKAGT